MLTNVGIALLTCSALLFVYGTGREGILWCVRTTPRPAVLFFVAAFAAAPVHRLWPTPTTQWMRANRRYLGVSFGAWHLVHLVGILALALPDPARFWRETDLLTLTVGGAGLGFVILMTATSFDRTARFIGARHWRMLHTTGVYLIWILFFDTYRGRTLVRSEWFDSVAYILLALAMVVRVAAFVKGRADGGRRARSGPIPDGAEA